MSDTGSVTERLEAFRAQQAADADAAQATTAADQERSAKLDAAKADCAAKCGPIAEQLAATEDPAERQFLADLEAETHAEHAAALEAAYLEFSGQREGESNPALPGVTQIDSQVASEVQPAAGG